MYFQRLSNGFYDLELMTHIVCIFVEYQTGGLQATILKPSDDFGKTTNICETIFYYYCPNIFSKLRSTVQWI